MIRRITGLGLDAEASTVVWNWAVWLERRERAALKVAISQDLTGTDG
jgi:hypothetical protein